MRPGQITPVTILAAIDPRRPSSRPRAARPEPWPDKPPDFDLVLSASELALLGQRRGQTFCLALPARTLTVDPFYPALPFQDDAAFRFPPGDGSGGWGFESLAARTNPQLRAGNRPHPARVAIEGGQRFSRFLATTNGAPAPLSRAYYPLEGGGTGSDRPGRGCIATPGCCRPGPGYGWGAGLRSLQSARHRPGAPSPTLAALEAQTCDGS